MVRQTLTALDAAAAHRDHRMPLVTQKEALPDCELIGNPADGGRVRLGGKPDTLAADGLKWRVNAPP